MKSELRVTGRQAGNDATFSHVATRTTLVQGVHNSAVKLFVEVGAASSSTLWVDCLAWADMDRRCLRRGLGSRLRKVKSESLPRGGVMTMTPDCNLDDGLSSRQRVCPVWVARLAGCTMWSCSMTTVVHHCCNSFSPVPLK